MNLLDHMPTRATWGGYIYLAAFNNPMRTVKVGSTGHPTSRIGSHRLDADAFGHQLIDSWVSQEHSNYLDTEQQLISLAATIANGRAKREYFHNVDFNALVALARGIEYLPEPDRVPVHIEAARRSGAERLAKDWSLWKPILAGQFYTFAELQEMTGLPLELVVEDFSGGLLPTGATGEALQRWVEKHWHRCNRQLGRAA